MASELLQWDAMRAKETTAANAFVRMVRAYKWDGEEMAASRYSIHTTHHHRTAKSKRRGKRIMLPIYFMCDVRPRNKKQTNTHAHRTHNEWVRIEENGRAWNEYIYMRASKQWTAQFQISRYVVRNFKATNTYTGVRAGEKNMKTIYSDCSAVLWHFRILFFCVELWAANRNEIFFCLHIRREKQFFSDSFIIDFTFFRLSLWPLHFVIVSSSRFRGAHSEQ